MQIELESVIQSNKKQINACETIATLLHAEICFF